MSDMRASTVRAALASDATPRAVKAVLQIRADLGKTSVAKLARLRTKTRARGCIRPWAAVTGRFGGKDEQPHNFERGTEPDAPKSLALELRDAWADEAHHGRTDLLQATAVRPLHAVGSVLRHLITAKPGHVLASFDLKSIEGMVLCWLARDPELEVYRANKDVYKVAARAIFGLQERDKVSYKQRMVGKVATLAMGYQGGYRAFRGLAHSYDLDLSDIEFDARKISDIQEWYRDKGKLLTDEDAKAELIKQQWRRSHPRVVRYWDDAAEMWVRACNDPGAWVTLGHGQSSLRARAGKAGLVVRLPVTQL